MGTTSDTDLADFALQELLAVPQYLRKDHLLVLPKDVPSDAHVLREEHVVQVDDAEVGRESPMVWRLDAVTD